MSLTAEQQFNEFCRTLEGQTSTIKQVNAADVYLFSYEKQQAAQEYIMGVNGTDAVIQVIKRFETPVLVADTGSTVFIRSAMVDDNKIVIDSVICAWNNSENMPAEHRALIGGRIEIDIAESGSDGYAAHMTLRSTDLAVRDHGTKRWRSMPLGQLGFEEEQELRRDLMTNTTTALEQLFYTTKPRVCVVEKTPRKVRITKHMAARAGDRPRIVVLDPDQVYTIRDGESAGGSHASPKAHVRRAHVRTLRHPRYGANVGKQIPIGETAINVKEGEVWTKSRTTYKVRSIGCTSSP